MRNSFDVQNLRHLAYGATSFASRALITDEIVKALNKSRFLADQTFLKLVQSLSPSEVHYMHQESRRAFPVVSFSDNGMPIMDCRIHAVTELLSCRALKNRNVFLQGVGKGVGVLDQWTELGLRLMHRLCAIDETRFAEMSQQIKTVPEDSLPPTELMNFPNRRLLPLKRNLVFGPRVIPRWIMRPAGNNRRIRTGLPSQIMEGEQ